MAADQTTAEGDAAAVPSEATSSPSGPVDAPRASQLGGADVPSQQQQRRQGAAGAKAAAGGSKDARLRRRCRDVLATPREQRSAADLNAVLTFCADVSEIGRLEPEQRLSVARAAQLVELPEGEVVFHQGDFGDKYYIIIEGECLVLVRSVVSAAEGAEVLRGGAETGPLGAPLGGAQQGADAAGVQAEAAAAAGEGGSGAAAATTADGGDGAAEHLSAAGGSAASRRGWGKVRRAAGVVTATSYWSDMRKRALARALNAEVGCGDDEGARVGIGVAGDGAAAGDDVRKLARPTVNKLRSILSKVRSRHGWCRAPKSGLSRCR